MTNSDTRMAKLAKRLKLEREILGEAGRLPERAGDIDTDIESPELLEKRRKALERLKTLKD